MDDLYRLSVSDIFALVFIAGGVIGAAIFFGDSISGHVIGASSTTSILGAVFLMIILIGTFIFLRKRSKVVYKSKRHKKRK